MTLKPVARYRPRTDCALAFLSLLSACSGGGEVSAPASPAPTPVTSPAPAPAPALSDKAIGSSAVSYQDPEINTADRRITWQDGAEVVWIADLDPATGEMIPSDGRGLRVGQAAPIRGSATRQGSFNGPEWGYSQAGAGVYFTQPDERGVYQVARHRAGVTERITAGGSSGRSAPLPSKNPRDPAVATTTYLGRFRDGNGVWAYETEPAASQPFPSSYFASSGPQWLDDAPEIVTNQADVNGIAQVARFDITTGLSRLLTEGADYKFDTYFLRDPTTGARMFVTSLSEAAPYETVPSVANRIGVYREVDGVFVKERELSVTGFGGPTSPRHFSVEPFIAKGRAYVSLAVTTGRVYEDPSSIWVMAVDGSFGRQISTLGAGERCIDPESFVSGDQVFIYYYNILQQGHQQLRLVQGFPPRE